jgi:hypothetical protein
MQKCFKKITALQQLSLLQGLKARGSESLILQVACQPIEKISFIANLHKYLIIKNFVDVIVTMLYEGFMIFF